MARVGGSVFTAGPSVGRQHPAYRVQDGVGATPEEPPHLDEPLEPPPFLTARGLPADWAEIGLVHGDRAIWQSSPDQLPAIDINSL